MKWLFAHDRPLPGVCDAAAVRYLWFLKIGSVLTGVMPLQDWRPEWNRYLEARKERSLVLRPPDGVD